MRLRKHLQRIQYGPYDVLLHVGVSGLLIICFSYFMAPFGAACVVFMIGIVKEISDALRPNDHFDVRDIISDVLGISIGYSLIQLSLR